MSDPELSPADLKAAYDAVWQVTPDDELTRRTAFFLEHWRPLLATGRQVFEDMHGTTPDTQAFKLVMIRAWMGRLAREAHLSPDMLSWALVAGHIWLQEDAGGAP